MRTVAYLIGILAFSFLSVNAGEIIVQGKVKNFKGDTLRFSYDPYQLLGRNKTQQVIVKNGLFTFKVNSDVPIRVYFDFGKVPIVYRHMLTFPGGKDSSVEASSFDPRMVFLYLTPGDRLTLTVDAASIQETLQFAGIGADNNILVNKEDWILNSYRERVLRNYHEPVYATPNEFLALVEKRYNYKIHFLDSMMHIYNISAPLQAIYYWQFYAEWVNARINYPKTHEMYTSEKLTLPPGYFDFLTTVKTAKEAGDKGAGYMYFLDGLMRKKFETRADSTQTFTAYIQQHLTDKAAYEYMAYALGKNLTPEMLDKFGANCPYPDLALLVKERYEHLQGMMPGSPAPKVNFLTPDGKTFSFDHFKGKYIYIDFWATWCGPCIKEIPSLMQLETEYHESDVQFLSISFDKDVDDLKWKNFIKENTMTAHQFRADATSHSLLTRVWNITTIPRFAILDKQGNVLDANAPFPSSKEIRPLLNKLLLAGTGKSLNP